MMVTNGAQGFIPSNYVEAAGKFNVVPRVYSNTKRVLTATTRDKAKENLGYYLDSTPSIITHQCGLVNPAVLTTLQGASS